MSRVSSSHLASVEYDEEKQEMTVQFLQGPVYRYFNVPKDVYEGIRGAQSPGGYFWSVVRDAYQYRRIA
jgi:hypothetical protein